MRGPGVVCAILKKDLIQFSRDRIYMVLSVVGLAMFITVFWLIPDTVEESVTVGLAHHDLAMLEQMLGESEEGMEVVIFPSEAALTEVIAGRAEAWRAADGELVIRDTAAGDPRPDGARRLPVQIGLSFPERFLADTAAGRAATVRLLVNDDTPEEIRAAMSSMVREIAFLLAGIGLPVTEPQTSEIILGADRMGAQVTMRERMRPMLVFFVLMMETFSLASLVAVEITHRTVTAVVATPAKLRHLLAAKSIHGIMLALGQALILLAAVGAFGAGNPAILVVAALIGAAMFTGIGMAVGSAGRDFIGTLFLTMACILPLAVPTFTALFPGAAPAWVRFVPSYGIMQTLVQVTSYGAGWADVAAPLGIAAAWLVVLFGAGLGILSRKAATL